MAKVLQLGAGGQGAAAIMQLVKIPEVSEIVLADVNLERARKLAKEVASDKISVERVDAFNADDLLKVAKGADVVINVIAASIKVNGESKTPTLNVFDAAFENGAHYVDVATGERKEEEEMLKLNNKWKEAGLTGIFDLGKTPGITNVLARYAVDKLDRTDSILVKSSLDVISEEFFVMWAPIWAIFGWMEPALVFENGEFKRFPPLSGEEVYHFPGDPQGPCAVHLADHGEVWTLPRFIKGVRYVEFKHGFHSFPIVKALGQLFGSGEPIRVKNVEVAPMDVLLAVIPPPAVLPEKIKAGVIKDAYSCCVVDVKGEKASRKTHYTLNCHINLQETIEKLPGATPESIMVGTPPVVAAEMLIKREIKITGVFPPECLDPEPFLARLAKKGVIVNERAERSLT